MKLFILILIFAMFVMSSRYEHGMENYGFSQGDIGKAMTVLTDTRSAVRGAIGYETEAEIKQLVTQYDEKKAAFWDYMKDVEACMVTTEGKASYKKIKDSADKYFAITDDIIKKALNRKYSEEITLTKLDDSVDLRAKDYIISLYNSKI